MASKERSDLSLKMNTDEFWRYLHGRFNEDFANLICFDLSLFVPLAFLGIEGLDGLEKHIEQCTKELRENSLKILFYCDDGNSKLLMKDSSIVVINGLRGEVMELVNKKKRARGNSTVIGSTDTTSTENNNQQVKKRKPAHRTDMKVLSMACRKRQIRCRHHDRDEWSFSSDEYMFPTLTELNSASYSNSNFDYQLWTIGRLDHFCTKYLMLKAGAEVRRFQHEAQCQLQMHQENLYEYLRFLRNHDHMMMILGNYLKEHVPESTDENLMTRIRLIIRKLIEMKQQLGFINLGYGANE